MKFKWLFLASLVSLLTLTHSCIENAKHIGSYPYRYDNTKKTYVEYNEKSYTADLAKPKVNLKSKNKIEITSANEDNSKIHKIFKCQLFCDDQSCLFQYMTYTDDLLLVNHLYTNWLSEECQNELNKHYNNEHCKV
jgi:hypothetical protein